MFSLSGLQRMGRATVSAVQTTASVTMSTAKLAGRGVTIVGSAAKTTVKTGCTIASYAVPHNTKVAAFAAGCGFYAKGVATTQGTRILTDMAVRSAVAEFGPIIGVKAATHLGLYGIAPFVVPPALPAVIAGTVLASTVGATVVGNIVNKLAQSDAKPSEDKKVSGSKEDIEANWDTSIEGTGDGWTELNPDKVDPLKGIISGN